MSKYKFGDYVCFVVGTALFALAIYEIILAQYLDAIFSIVIGAFNFYVALKRPRRNNNE